LIDARTVREARPGGAGAGRVERRQVPCELVVPIEQGTVGTEQAFGIALVGFQHTGLGHRVPPEGKAGSCEPLLPLSVLPAPTLWGTGVGRRDVHARAAKQVLADLGVAQGLVVGRGRAVQVAVAIAYVTRLAVGIDLNVPPPQDLRLGGIVVFESCSCGWSGASRVPPAVRTHSRPRTTC
jgi:hypothetical protein